MDSMKTLHTQATLVDYNEPEVVCDVEEELDGSEPPAVLDVSIDNEIKRMMTLRLAPNCPDPNTFEELDIDMILNILIPPIEWVEDGKLWRQKVSSEEVSRDDLMTLSGKLDSMLATRRAASQGICPIRRELYAQFFDELIRQVTILIPETGLLLMRVRDELHMTLDATASVYESCKSFESKCINIPKKNVDMETVEKADELVVKVDEIETAKNQLREELRNLKDGLELLEIKLQETLDAEKSLFEEDAEHLKKVKLQLEKQLKLFQGPNPHAEVAVESILDKYLLNQAPPKE